MKFDIQKLAAIEDTIYAIKVVQKSLEYADIPDPQTYPYAGGIDVDSFVWGYGYEGIKELADDLISLSTRWKNGADALKSIAANFYDSGAADDHPFLCAELKKATAVANAKSIEIESIAERIANMSPLPNEDWATDAAILIDQLGFMELPIEVIEDSNTPSRFVMDCLFPFNDASDSMSGKGDPSKLCNLGKSLATHAPVFMDVLVNATFVLGVVLFPFNIGLSFLALAGSLAVECCWNGYWAEVFPMLMILLFLYAGLISWFG